MLAVELLIILGATLFFFGTLYDRRAEKQRKETQAKIKRQRRHCKCNHCGMLKELH